MTMMLNQVPRWIGVKDAARRGSPRGARRRPLGGDPPQAGPARVVLAKQAFTGPESSAQRVELLINGGTLGLREGGAVLECAPATASGDPSRGRQARGLHTRHPRLHPALVEVVAATRYWAKGGGGLVVVRSRAPRAWRWPSPPRLPGVSRRTADSKSPRRHRRPPWDYEVGTPIAARCPRTRRATPTTRERRRRGQGTAIQERRDRREGRLPGAQSFRAPARARRSHPARPAPPGLSHRQPGPSQAGRGNQADAGGQRRSRGRSGTVSSCSRANTKVFSNFAETRTYVTTAARSTPRSTSATNLAAVRHGPVPAANAGVVVFAGPLSIYGNTVIVDHGLGLQTLYAHLSTIEVKEGDRFGRSRTWDARATPGSPWAITCTSRYSSGGSRVTPVEVVGCAMDPRPHRSAAAGGEPCSSSSRSCPKLAKEAGRAAAPPSSRGHRVPALQPTTKAESP